jgi:NADH:ubiquinone oxidoreductase subunit F (NADH-binding)/(2Fe-2S) ferredoxin/ferredoxin
MDISELFKNASKEWENLLKGDEPFFMVGNATCGRSAGSTEVIDQLNIEASGSVVKFTVCEVGCIGMCYVEPIVSVYKPGYPVIFYGSVTKEDATELVTSFIEKGELVNKNILGVLPGENSTEMPLLFDTPVLKSQERIVLNNCGIIDPTNLNHYMANKGYSGLRRALAMETQGVIDEIKNSGLRGRGGAGFPTGKKWQFAKDQDSETKYIVCNADEGDPGAFMNRSLLEGDPHSLLEGMIIAGYAIGADHGYIYCRAEYPLALERLDMAIKQAAEKNLLGKNIMDTEFDFTIKVKEGAGAFVCGEETALIASIEGKRGMPNTRPPFPAISGLWGNPTIINNVETLTSVARVLQNNPEWFSKYGTEKSKGTKTFALVGKVNNTGLIEVPLGTTLKDIIFDIGGGVFNDKKLKAVQTGGPSGGCVPANMMNIPVDYESLAEAGTIMGSGGLVVMDEDTCMVDVARYFVDFARKESCGKCGPCRLGTRQMFDIAKVCRDLIYYDIIEDKCTGCHACYSVCPVNAISGNPKDIHTIDQDTCVKCGLCFEKCPDKFNAIEIHPGSKEIEV